MVHQHDVVLYYFERELAPESFQVDESNEYTLLSFDMSSCPHVGCDARLSSDAAFDIRIAGATIACVQCGRPVAAEDMRVASYVRDHPTIRFAATHNIRANLCSMPRGWQSQPHRHVIYGMDGRGQPEHGVLGRHFRRTTGRNRHHALQRRTRCTTGMARHLAFLGHVFQLFDMNWRLDASIVRYCQFHHLCNLHKLDLVPTMDIALVQYVHQTISSLPRWTIDQLWDRMSCATAPSTDTAAVAYTKTYVLWAETFHGAAYSSYPPNQDAYLGRTNAVTRRLRLQTWNQVVRMPSRDCRFVGVDERLSSLALVDGDDKALHVAVVGTPWIDTRLQLLRDATILGKTTTVDNCFGWSPWKMHHVWEDMTVLMSYQQHTKLVLKQVVP
ncbi:Aste57867_1549 [Aphanomyces stellatus]|uniref:Aste57867_1549 protein n=1 Tax=Aphanomyces stellatus TaxID=120398 RepID=A0A485K8X3_9STRA|nr:hypothetical protein As57867_001548 [Aphanomyces stellatus]VFT78763.1 Aste57867_1549 [Aphanomyces stellatus]